MEGWPYNYCYFREEPSAEALKAFGVENGLCFENGMQRTKDGLFAYDGSAHHERWTEFFDEIWKR